MAKTYFIILFCSALKKMVHTNCCSPPRTQCSATHILYYVNYTLQIAFYAILFPLLDNQ